MCLFARWFFFSRHHLPRQWCPAVRSPYVHLPELERNASFAPQSRHNAVRKGPHDSRWHGECHWLRLGGADTGVLRQLCRMEEQSGLGMMTRFSQVASVPCKEGESRVHPRLVAGSQQCCWYHEAEKERACWCLVHLRLVAGSSCWFYIMHFFVEYMWCTIILLTFSFFMILLNILCTLVNL